MLFQVKLKRTIQYTTRFVLFILLALTLILVIYLIQNPKKINHSLAATTITVSPSQSIQTTCLDKVNPGDTCLINVGTYNESLTLKKSGSASAPITIKCATTKGCTINSSGSKTIQTSSAHQSYYTFDGLRLISTMSGGESATTNDFATGWSLSYNMESAGNTNITLKNCYVA